MHIAGRKQYQTNVQRGEPLKFKKAYLCVYMCAHVCCAWCMYVCMCVCTCVRRCLHTHVCLCGSQSKTSGIFQYHSPPCTHPSPKTESFTKLGTHCFPFRLASKSRSSPSLHTLCPLSWGYRCIWSCLPPLKGFVFIVYSFECEYVYLCLSMTECAGTHGSKMRVSESAGLES